MQLDHGAFLRGQRGRLEEDTFAYPHLPSVVQQRAENQLFAPGGWEVEAVGDRRDVARNLFEVTSEDRVLDLYRLGGRANGRQ